jgi:hypothetical protein
VYIIEDPLHQLRFALGQIQQSSDLLPRLGGINLLVFVGA